MNIFVLDRDPYKAAKMLCDKHVVKMHVEGVQMLVSALRRWLDAVDVKRKDGHQHLGGYAKHPCTRWAGDSIRNFQWLLSHTHGLCYEHQHRYGKQPYSLIQLDEIELHYNRLRNEMMSSGCIDQTPFALAMPDEYKITDSPVRSYRRYYKNEKAQFAEWSRGRTAPLWFVIK